jgi:hypothetical protein
MLADVTLTETDKESPSDLGRGFQRKWDEWKVQYCIWKIKRQLFRLCVQQALASEIYVDSFASDVSIAID